MARVVTVEPVLFAYMFCTFMSFPIQQQLIYRKVCHSHYSSSLCGSIDNNRMFRKEEKLVQGETSEWMLYQSLCITLPSAVTTLLFGSWSDRVGRKYIMILPLIGGALESAGMVANAYYFKASVPFIFIGNSLAGLFGSYATVLLSVFAYMSDITVKEKRTLRIGILEAMTFLGGFLGEFIGGVLLDHSGFVATYSLTLSIQSLTLLYILCLLPESFFPAEKLRFKESCTSEHFVHAGHVLAKKRANKQRSSLLLLLAIFIIQIVVFVGTINVSVLYVLHEPLKFSSSWIGYYLATQMIIKAVGNLVGMPVFTKILKLTDYTMIVIGTFSMMLMYLITGFAKTKWLLFLATIAGIGGGIPVPCVRSLMSKMIEKDEQGTLFAAVASVEVLCSLVASSIFNEVYKATLGWYTGFCFFLMAAILFIPIFCTWFLQTRREHMVVFTAMFHTSCEKREGEEDSSFSEMEERASICDSCCGSIDERRIIN